MNHAHDYLNNHINLLQPAQIGYHGRTFSATLGSLTRDGALLETHALTLPVGMEVDLSLTLGRSSWQIKAVITHTTPHEIGLLFRHSQPQLYNAAHDQLPLSFQPSRHHLSEPATRY